MYAEYVNNKRYGYPGGVLSQPDGYWRDMNTMRWLALWNEHVKNAPRMEQVSVFDRLRGGQGLSGDWRKSNG